MLRRFFRAFVFCFALLVGANAHAAACGVEKDCKTKSGSYRYVTPEGWNGIDPIGAVVYLHGRYEDAASLFEYGDMVQLANDLGAAVITPNSLSARWSVPGSLSGHGRDDLAFVAQALEAAEKRFTLDKSKILLAGFSHGASLVWHIACSGDSRYAGFLAVGGSFWQPVPTNCTKTNVPFFHYHGATDPRYPLDGRMVNSAGVQAGLETSFAALGQGAQCSPMVLPEVKLGQLMCNLSLCKGRAGYSSMQLCVHSGGHVISKSWIKSVWRSVFASHD